MIEDIREALAFVKARAEIGKNHRSELPTLRYPDQPATKLDKLVDKIIIDYPLTRQIDDFIRLYKSARFRRHFQHR